MELEVSQKVRAAIKAKLVELGVHVDEELPDYIMVLIANRRTPSQMESDLNLFLGDQTHRFVGWLTHVLKKLEEVTAAASTQPQPAKKRKSSTTPSEQEAPPKKLDAKPEVEEPTKKKKSKPEKSEETVQEKPEKQLKKPDKKEVEEKASTPPPPSPKKHSPKKTRVATPPHYKPPHRSKSRDSPPLHRSKSRDSPPLHRSKSRDSPPLHRSKSRDSPPLHRSKSRDSPPLHRSKSRESPPLHRSKSRDSPPIHRSKSRESPPPKQHSEEDNLQKMRSELLKSKPKPRQISPIRRSRSRSRSPQRRSSPQRRRSRTPPTSPRKHPLSRTPPRQTRSRSPVSLQRHENYKARSSVFERLLNRRRNVSPQHRHNVTRRSRSKSNSPPRTTQPRKVLSSVVVKKSIESIIKPPVLSSVVKKVEVPKARNVVEKPSKLLLKAVSEANADAAFKQNPGGKTELERKVERRLEGDKKERSDVRRKEEAPPQKRSIRDRLGVRVVTRERGPVLERLGVRGGSEYFHENITVTVEGNEEYNPEDYVEAYNPEDGVPRFTENEDSAGEVFGDSTLSPSSLALHVDSDTVIPRISIAVNDDDTSDEDDDEDSDREREQPKDTESRRDSEEKEEEEESNSPQESPQPEKDEGEDEDTIVLQQNSPLQLEMEENKVEEVPEEKEQVVASDLREKLVKRHNAKKNASKKQETEPPKEPKPEPTQPQKQAQTPPTVVINPTVQKPQPIQISPALPTLPLPTTPTQIPCKFGHACLYKPTCKFLHPPTIYCKFDLHCKNATCPYKHSRKPPAMFKGAVQKSSSICKFHPKCTNLQCTYYHPAFCKFGSMCTNKTCKFYHEGRETPGMVGGKFVVPGGGLPQRSLLKWEKK